MFVLALASLGAAFFYTAGSKALGYVALGEVTVFLFMGPAMVCGAYYVLAGNVTWTAVLLSIPIGALSAATLHANNIRDIEHDRNAGKTTLATLLGRERASTEYLIWIVVTYAATALTVLFRTVVVADIADSDNHSQRHPTCSPRLLRT